MRFPSTSLLFISVLLLFSSQASRTSSHLNRWLTLCMTSHEGKFSRGLCLCILRIRSTSSCDCGSGLKGHRSFATICTREEKKSGLSPWFLLWVFGVGVSVSEAVDCSFPAQLFSSCQALKGLDPDVINATCGLRVADSPIFSFTLYWKAWHTSRRRSEKSTSLEVPRSVKVMKASNSGRSSRDLAESGAKCSVRSRR